MSQIYLLRNFSAFTLIGGLFFVLAVAMNGIAIDVFGLSPAVAPLVIISGLFVAKYYVSLLTRVILPDFWRYTVANLAVTMVSTFTIWLMVHFGGLSGGLSTAIALGFFFVVRYAVLHSVNVIRKEP